MDTWTKFFAAAAGKTVYLWYPGKDDYSTFEAGTWEFSDGALKSVDGNDVYWIPASVLIKGSYVKE